MLVIGLTGGIATGKSSVSKILTSHRIPIVDADILARQVVEPGTTGLKRIVKAFGTDILLPDGTLDRKKLGSIIFNDETKRRILNSIVHPAVQRAMLLGVLKLWIRGEKYCFLDVPLLIEGGLWKWVAATVVVFCSQEVQLQRLMQRDGSTEADASSRLNSQMPIADKLQYADLTVDNSGTPEQLEERVMAMVADVQKRASPFWWIINWVIPPVGISSAFWVIASRFIRRKLKGRREEKDN